VDSFDLNALIGGVGNLYTRHGLSPPIRLREAAKHWRGLVFDEIIDTIEVHIDQHRRLYTSGSGDRIFPMVEAAIKKLYRDKHEADDASVKPEPQARRGIRHLHHGAGGLPDVIDDRDDGASIGEDGEDA
jgi:hypothetical protein